MTMGNFLQSAQSPPRRECGRAGTTRHSRCEGQALGWLRPGVRSLLKPQRGLPGPTRPDGLPPKCKKKNAGCTSLNLR